MAKTTSDKLANAIPSILVILDGKAIEASYQIESIKVNHFINQISTAEIVLVEEAIGLGNSLLIDDNDFNPGVDVEISAGYMGREFLPIFKGIITKLSLKSGRKGKSTFKLGCKHEAVKMTYKLMDRYFEDSTDDDAMSSVFSYYNFASSIGSCAEVNPIIFQKKKTDWDFILSRAHYNGFVITQDENFNLVIDKPNLNAAAVLTVEAGMDIFSFQGSLSAEFQPSSVKASAWDPQDIDLLTAVSTEPQMNSQGNLGIGELAEMLSQEELHFVTSTPMTSAALQLWANSILLQKRLRAFKGEIKILGNSLVKTGSIIELSGVGDRLSGMAFVTSVEHTLIEGKWSTIITFGLDEERPEEERQGRDADKMNQYSTAQGLQLATVRKIDQDPEGLYRIQVEIPSASAEPNVTWARMAQYYATSNSGFFFLPELDDEVVLGFLENDSTFPIILGSLYNGKKSAPYVAEEDNNIKAIVTRSNMKIEFDEDKKDITISTPANNFLKLSEDGKSIELKDQNDNSVLLSSEGITLISANDVTISGNDIKISASGNLEMEASQQLKADGGASAALSAAGQITINGALVSIN